MPGFFFFNLAPGASLRPASGRRLVPTLMPVFRLATTNLYTQR